MNQLTSILLGILLTFNIAGNTQELNNQLKDSNNKVSSVEEPIFYLDENGVTIKCENCQSGDKGVVNSISYEAVDRLLLIQRIDEGADMSGLCTSLVSNMEEIFMYASSFNQIIGSWDVSKITNMYSMFNAATSFNQNIGFWDVSNVTNMMWMFRQATSFNKDIGNWDVSNVTNMTEMFSYSTSFNQDIRAWDVSNVKHMGGMFSNASSFNQDIGSWEVGNVTNMGNMFHSATSFNQDIGDWNVSKVTNMGGMFRGADSFNQDLSNWCVINIPKEPGWFASGSDLDGEYYPKWGTCPTSNTNENNAYSNKIKMFPIPADNYVQFDVNTNLQNATVEIYDTYGNKMLQQKLIGNNRINVGKLNSGVYLYKLIQNNIIYSGIIVIK